MCGIVACLAQSPIDRGRFERALRLLAHRGPDSSSTWFAPDGRLALGFRRLAIVGPVHESQPFSSPDGVQAAVNGEIYGHAALRRELEIAGARFQTASDCEVVLHGYRLFGPDYLSRLNGEFAGVIWDSRVRTLVAFRDRWGVKPLYYAQRPDQILIASEVKSLFELGHPARWDRSNLFQHFLASVGPSQSLFDGIDQVRPGELIAWNEGRATRLALRPQDPVSQTTDSVPQQMEALAAALRAAVADRFQGNARIACYLSGGIDSTTVTALASDHGRPDTFTVEFGDGVESAQAAATALQLGLRHHVVPVGTADLVSNFEATVWHAETVGFNAVGAARLLLSRALAERGFKVALVGDGADELFGGYAFNVMDSFCQRSREQADWARRVLQDGRLAFLRELGAEGEPFGLTTYEEDGPAPFLLTSWTFHRSDMRLLLSAELLHEQRGLNPYDRLCEDIGIDALRAHKGLQRSMFIWQQSLFVNHILAAERLDMAHGVESRYPFLDDRVASQALALSDDALVHDLREKRMLRQTVADLLPPGAGRHAKRPFAAPLLCAGDTAAFTTYLRDRIASAELRRSGVIDGDAAMRMVDALPRLSLKSRQRADSLLMLALSFVALQTRFGLTA